jgi:hypothetical protein
MIVKENIVTTTNTNAERDDLSATCEYCLQGIPLDSRMPIPMHNMMPPNTPDTDTHFWKKCRATRPSVDDSDLIAFRWASSLPQEVQDVLPTRAVKELQRQISALVPTGNVAAVAEAASEIWEYIDKAIDEGHFRVDVVERIAAIISRHLNGACGCAARARTYAEGIASQNDVSQPVENWSDFHKGQRHAALELAAIDRLTTTPNRATIYEQSETERLAQAYANELSKCPNRTAGDDPLKGEY